MDITTCKLCNGQGHSSSRCKELCSDLREGFYKGGGPSGDHNDDDEEECLFINTISGNFEAQNSSQVQGSKAGH